VGFDIVLELVSDDLTRVWPCSDEGQRWVHRHDDIEMYWGGPFDSEPGFAHELAVQARAAGLSVMENNVVGRVQAEPAEPRDEQGDGQSRPIRMHITRGSAVTLWLRQVFDDCSLTSSTLPRELEDFFGVPASRYQPASLQVTMAIGAICYSSLFIGPIYGDHVDDEMQKTWIPFLAEAAGIAGLPNATPRGIWDRYVAIGNLVSRASEAGQSRLDAAAALITSWMLECLPQDVLETRQTEIQQWIAQEVSLYLAFVSRYWADFADEHIMLEA